MHLVSFIFAITTHLLSLSWCRTLGCWEEMTIVIDVQYGKFSAVMLTTSEHGALWCIRNLDISSNIGIISVAEHICENWSSTVDVTSTSYLRIAGIAEPYRRRKKDFATSQRDIYSTVYWTAFYAQGDQWPLCSGHSSVVWARLLLYRTEIRGSHTDRVDTRLQGSQAISLTWNLRYDGERQLGGSAGTTLDRWYMPASFPTKVEIANYESVHRNTFGQIWNLEEDGIHAIMLLDMINWTNNEVDNE